ncbi:MAG TPA: HD domain-containing protein [Planctomycetota bacterium]|nr:HD domain-containing protein [Planctomycetota bacterium]
MASLERALLACLEAHEGQFRKGSTATPYATHPMQVALIVARWDGSEEEILAGLLHDVVEDCPGWSHERVAAEFGPDVARIVREVSEDKSQSWEERKRAAIRHAPELCPGAAAVKAADQVHNWRSLALELRDAADADALWASFRGGRERTLAMAAELAHALSPRLAPCAARELSEALAELLEAATRAPRI